MNYVIFTDGAASQFKVNGKWQRAAGGHSFVVYENNIKIYEEADGAAITTNNEQELTAILKALKWLQGKKFDEATICSDSSYCINIFTKWINKWKANSWYRGKKKETIENLEIIKEIDNLLAKMPQVKFLKVKGHSNSAGNIRADYLAVEAKNRFWGN